MLATSQVVLLASLTFLVSVFLLATSLPLLVNIHANHNATGYSHIACY